MLEEKQKPQRTAPMQTKAQIIAAFAVVAIAFVLFLLLPVSNGARKCVQMESSVKRKYAH